jgi:phospholipase D1/2
MTIDGPVVLDIVQHFVERWNEVKGRKVRNHFHPEFALSPTHVPH